MKRRQADSEFDAKRQKTGPIHKVHQQKDNVSERFSSPQSASHNYHQRQHHQQQSRKHLSVHPISGYDRDFPYFRKPSEIGSFSQDINRKFSDDSTQLKLYCPPSNANDVHFNLRDGYNVYDKRDETVRENLDDLLRWICCHKDKFAVPNQQTTSLSTDFICWRGLLTKVLCTPYENRDGWLIAVTLYNNTYYMCEFDSEDKLLQQQNESEKQKEMAYWGVKFEQYVTADPESAKPNLQRVTNNKEAYGSVVRGRLHKHSIVYGGEIDGYEMDGDKRNYVELKTSREIEHPRQLINFKRFKAIKWWAQSFLIGIEKIVCGFRDDDGVVHRLEDFSTQGLPKYCQDISNCWQPNVCFNFLDSFLQFVKDCVRTDDRRAVHMFSWRPREPVKCTSCPPESEYSFLPDWYNTEDRSPDTPNCSS